MVDLFIGGELGLVDGNALTLGSLLAGLVTGAQTALTTHLLVPFFPQLLFPSLPSSAPSYILSPNNES